MDKTCGDCYEIDVPFGAASRKAIRLCPKHAKVDKLIEALKEIAKGEGPFSLDRFTHATNTIVAMKELATTALNSVEVKHG